MPKAITIIGLGPGNPALLTLEAQQILNESSELVLRTQKHPTVSHLPRHLALRSFDHIYEEKETFEQVYAEIVRQLLELAQRPEGVCYAVPGHPLVGEATVRGLLDAAAQANLPVRIVAGVSFLEPIFQTLRLDPLQGFQILDAIELALRRYPPVNADLPLLIGQVYSQHLASEVKLALMNVYPDEHRVTLISAAGLPEEKAQVIPLYELDRQRDIAHLTSLYVPPLPEPGAVESFMEVVARLRAPDGCPWDREQSHASLRPYLLEESYEVLAALDAEDTESLCEELGDLLLQVLLHTQIAVEESEFGMSDVVRQIVAKLKRRHPHVFGDVQVSGSAEVLVNWEAIKKAEKAAKMSATKMSAAKKAAAAEGAPSLLSSIPRALPALSRAQAIQERVRRVGFDWPNLEGVLGKVAEELGELREAPEERRGDELGDLLFSLVNLARWYKLDAETLLRETVERFTRRFQRMEQLCTEQGRALAELTPAEQDGLWEKVKSAE
jgi:tetrapyrrole methylase family protein/MazG family protein